MIVDGAVGHITARLKQTALGRVLAWRVSPAATVSDPPLHVRILPHRGDEASPEADQLFFAALHGADLGPLSLEITAEGGQIGFGLTCRQSALPCVEAQLAAGYPGVVFQQDADRPDLSGYQSIPLRLALPSIIPIQTFAQPAADALAALLPALSALPPDQAVRLVIQIESEPNVWQEAAMDYAAALRHGVAPRPGWQWLFSDTLQGLWGLASGLVPAALGRAQPAPLDSEKRVQLSTAQQELVQAIEEKAGGPGFRTAIQLAVRAAGWPAAREAVLTLARLLEAASPPHLNRLVAGRKKDAGFVLAVPELAGLWHLPGRDTHVPGITWAPARRAEPPLALPTDDCTLLARSDFRGDERIFGLRPDDRFRHLYVVGKAGTGKSTLLKTLIVQDMRQGHGLAVLDPHGDLYEELLDLIPLERIKDVVLLDPGDQDYPVSLNVLELPDPSQRSQVASALVDILKRSFEHSWGPRLEYILRNCILTLLEVPHATIMGIPRLLADEGYRAWTVAQIQDPVLRFFWEREFAAMLTNPRLVTEAISPVQNKVGQFLSSPLLRRILAQPRSTIRGQDILEGSQILLVNLSKGRIGEDSSSLLGAMIVANLHFATMRRVSQPQGERRPFFLYADEFQSFATSTFASILSEARKYRLGLVLAHQYTSQLPEGIRDAIFGNVGTLLSFAVGPDDARFLASQFAPALSAEDLLNLDRYHLAVRLLVDGTATPGFTAVGLPPVEERTGSRERAIAASRARYARQAAVVDQRIRTWSERVYRPPRWPARQAQRSAAEAPARLALLDEGEATESEDAVPAPATDQMGASGE